MGAKISVDSATMMNKGLELIEACLLFDRQPDEISIVIHPQSIIHSMVEYVDGSVLAQMGQPDMRVAIATALAWPERTSSGVAAPDFITQGELSFLPADMQRYPCLQLALQAARAGGLAPVLLNAANEIAVQAFLHGQIGFTHIPAIIEPVLAMHCDGSDDCLQDLLSVDGRARQMARQLVSRCAV